MYLCAKITPYYIYNHMAGIYLHFPFCASRCVYCDFYSTTQVGKSKAYVKALCNELKLRSGYLSSNGQSLPVETVYWGGGTPSTLGTGLMEEVFDTLYATFPVVQDAEITLEANPDDLSAEKIKAFSKLPFNRLSMGIQTFSDDKLTFLNRRHTGQQAIDAVKACQDAGFDNISIDLIYGLPGQTAGQWEDDLDVAIGMNIQHLSAYALIYEEGTRLWEMRKKRIVEEADEETSLQMFDLLIDKLLNAGFEHYEISNFARKGCRSRHNSSYWKGIPYLGCGPSAHSYDGRNRQWNTPNLELYLREVGCCASPEDFMEAAWIEKEQLSTAERYNDLVVTALRTCEGIDLSSLRHSFGDSFAAYCLRNAAPHLQKGSLEILPVSSAFSEGRLRLTRKGLFLSDGIMSDLLWVEETD